jgi:RNA polymerase sigma-70 factor, ECF subfamily
VLPAIKAKCNFRYLIAHCTTFTDVKNLQLENKGNHIIQPLNQASFEMLFRSHFSGLCFFAQKYVKDFETAKEIVQDAFLSLWEKRSSIDMDRPVKSYLTMVIHNKCTNYLRDNRKFDSYILNLENLLEVPEYEGADSMVENELKAKIEAALVELPEKCREIFILNRYENLKYQEIADKLQISVKTVETQMSKALQHMRVRLAEYITIVVALVISFFSR